MTRRSSLITGRFSSAATALLLLALSGASLGCALAACLSMAEPASDIAAEAASAVTAAPRAPAPVAQPMARTEQPSRCLQQGARLRRHLAAHGACRAADLPPV
jgi:hypothetical protein